MTATILMVVLAVFAFQYFLRDPNAAAHQASFMAAVDRLMAWLTVGVDRLLAGAS